MPSFASCSMRMRIVTIERQLQHLDEQYRVKTSDGLHDLLLRIGDLDVEELEARASLERCDHDSSARERAPGGVAADRRNDDATSPSKTSHGIETRLARRYLRAARVAARARARSGRRPDAPVCAVAWAVHRA